MESLLFRWQHMPYHIPSSFSIGPVELRWYGLMYVIAFVVSYLLVMYRLRRERYPYSKETVQNFFMAAVIAVLVGARLGYMVFYDLDTFLARPASIFGSFDGSGRFAGISGMSYHGGLLLLLAAFIIFCRLARISFLNFSDLIVPVVPLGYTFGRIGNFINGELYGRITALPWGMYFSADPSGALRHPSQLYEAFFEGLLLFIVLWRARGRGYAGGVLTAVYLAGYGFARFCIEFVREPDAQVGFVAGPFTMGQVLCAAMIAAGGVLYFIARRRALRLKAGGPDGDQLAEGDMSPAGGISPLK